MLQLSIAGPHSSRSQTLNIEDGFQLLAILVQEMMSLSLEDFTTWLQIHLLKLERWKQARCFCELGDSTSYTSAETRKVEGKLDGLVNLMTQLAVNQKPASVARVCGIRSSNNHHTNVCPSSLQPGVNEHHKAYAANIYRPSQRSRVQRLDREDGFQLLAISLQEMMPLSIEEFMTWRKIHLLKLERWKSS
ncbi:hypothetical protein Fmac_024840 [Flemingia macrophylla]|uniref:Uncharacterized protein n=1 Tax=Flemingia macrophylla TaxID=520843 RepID=A0ABD1LQI3_9FABA